MSEKRVRWNPAQQKTIERRGQQVKGALKTLGTLLFGTDDEVKQIGSDVLEDARKQRDEARERHGAIDVVVDEED